MSLLQPQSSFNGITAEVLMRPCKRETLNIKKKCYPGTPTQENPCCNTACVVSRIKEIWQSLGFEGKKTAFVKYFNVYCTAVCGSFISLYLMSNNLESNFNESKSWLMQKNSALNSNKLPNLVS